MNILKLLFYFFTSIAKSFYTFIRTRYTNAVLQTKNKTCIISPTSNINKAKLADWVVIFDNVTVYNCDIGRHSYIQKNSRIFNAKIGNFCSIGSNVSIAPGIHMTTGVSTHPSFYLKNTPLAITFSDKDFITSSKDVIIGHDVWIGENAIIFDGITIGTGAIIAAGSVVSKNVKPYTIVGGVPATIFSHRFSSDLIAELLNSEWWNLPDSWFRENFITMHNISDFLTQQKNNNDRNS